ncbi:DUF998 domain-containing protein [Actinomadura sp. ATCC 31491]|uniref:DUF998 domain-containing protein n=1 Tax=Actinomadura luzonensis TaxID=2805427 RepID=A0ABT0FZ57_9ACTN|nr:DUF998 domain-containing protein [Actinomadura luzonensis]MCK2217168.1 DUF998 domain-containing protein [Actinomadura luzonensis]
MRTLTPPAPEAPRAPAPGPVTRRLLACGPAAGTLFVGAFLVQGALRAGYDPLRHPVSSLALGPHGWVQSANFVVAGLLTLAFTAGLARALRGSRSLPVLVGIWGAMLVAAGVFTTDPVSGYPPGTPDLLPHYSGLAAELHDLVSLPAFVALPVACAVFAVRCARAGERAWAVYSAVSAVVFAVAFGLATAAFAQAPALVAYGGLFQRVAVVTGWAWLALLGVRLLRRP